MVPTENKKHNIKCQIKHQSDYNTKPSISIQTINVMIKQDTSQAIQIKSCKQLFACTVKLYYTFWWHSLDNKVRTVYKYKKLKYKTGCHSQDKQKEQVDF